jgi:hypothetical protein
MKKPNKKTAASLAAKKPTDESGKLLGIAARIMRLSADVEPAASWRDRVKRALSGSRNRYEGIIRAGQAMRDAGADVDFANFSICLGAEGIAEERRTAKMNRDREAAKHGRALDEDGPDWRSRQVEADVLREFGENEMADALLADEDTFIAKYREPGRLAHFGPLPTKPTDAKETKHEQG